MKNPNYAYITDVEMDGIDYRDAPDFVDAFISSALIDGQPATEAQLDALNEDPNLVSYFLQKYLH